MLELLFRKILPTLSLALTFFIPGIAFGKETPASASPLLSGTYKVGTNAITRIGPGPADGRIAFITGKMLEQLQYDHQAFDNSISSKFLDKYLETLDPQHLHFLQSDIEEFEHYRTELDDLTVNPSQGVADVKPGFLIFNRFVQRLAERVVYADQLLLEDTFSFDGDERITVNRRDLPYPKTLDEAQKLWRERLRFEYLQEKLGRAETKKKAEKDPRLKKTEEKDAVKAPEKSDHQQIVETLSNRYHRNLRTFTDWDNDDVLQIYLTAMSHVFDPHSDYMNQEQLDSFSIGMNLSLFGIGAELTSEDGYCTIRRLLPGGPAEKSKKIKEKDKIVAVAQGTGEPVDVVDMSLNKAVQLIRGPKGTEVRLTVIPAGGSSADRQVITLVRDEIKLDDQAAKAKLIELPGEGQASTRLGVIDLPSFYATFDPGNSRGKSANRSTSADVARLLSKLKQERVDGIVLDLRRNGGGSLEEAIRLTGLFIKQGPVVQVKDSEGLQEDRDEDPSMLYDGPLVVLTSRFSASASEILAGALQDYGRALVVGDSSTHGKGTVQSVNYLKPYMNLRQRGPVWTNEPGALKVTIKKFYRASGASTQLKGVVPDIVLPSVFSESKDIGESALENPMPWDTIESSKFDQFNMVAQYLPELRRRSVQRVAEDREFDYIREDIEHFKQMQEDKTISLNEQQRIREKEEIDARNKSRDQERRARAESRETIYEITLKNVDLPGLPAPLAKTNSLNQASAAGAGAVTTDHSAAVEPREDPLPLDDEALDEKSPAVDAVLTEAQRILVDYIAAMRGGSIAATRPASAPSATIVGPRD